MLNITKDGTINEAGHAFLFGSFIQKEKYKSLPREVIARKIPQPFTVELPDGSVAVGAANDYVLLNADFTVAGMMTAAAFAAEWDLASISAV